MGEKTSTSKQNEFYSRLQALRGQRKNQDYALPPIDLRRHIKEQPNISSELESTSPERNLAYKEQINWIKSYYIERLAKEA